MVAVLESHLEALTNRTMMILDATRTKVADAIENVCHKEPEEIKYEIMQRCTTIICNRKSKEMQEKS